MTEPDYSKTTTRVVDIHLKPCPFCGSTEVHILHYGTNSEHSVVCDNCHVWVDHIFEALSEEQALELWNRRVNG